MCDYCDMTEVNVTYINKDYFIHKSFYAVDKYTHEVLKANGINPVLYLRECREADHWPLICEFADDVGMVVEAPVSHCPRCGRTLTKNEVELPANLIAGNFLCLRLYYIVYKIYKIL